jgi:hypothetical protein
MSFLVDIAAQGLDQSFVEVGVYAYVSTKGKDTSTGLRESTGTRHYPASINGQIANAEHEVFLTVPVGASGAADTLRLDIRFNMPASFDMVCGWSRHGAVITLIPPSSSRGSTVSSTSGALLQSRQSQHCPRGE